MPGSATASRTHASVGVAALAWVAIVLGSVVAAQIIIVASGHGGDDADLLPFSVVSASLAAQWAIALAVLWLVSTRHLTGHPVRDYRIRMRPVDLLGIPIGVLCQLVLLELVYWPLRSLFEEVFSRSDVEEPARSLTDRADGAWKIALVLAVVVCAPFVEETLYRGLLQGSLEARLADWLAVVLTAAWFALAHIQGVQLPGLLAFGLVLSVCAQRTGRLGMGMLAHAAFNATSLAVLW